MYLFKRYDEKTNILASYLPWLYLVKDNIIRNKDGSLLCAFIYEDIDTAILKQIAVSNISLWIDYVDKQKTLYIVYNPLLYNADLKKINSSIEKFSEFILEIEHNFRLCSLKNTTLINSLYKIITIDKTISMMNNPIYLDYKLTKNHSYKKYLKEYLVIDEYYLQCVKLLGYPEFLTKSLILYLEHNNIQFRYNKRLIFLSDKDKQKEIQRYTKNWSKSHKEFLKVLTYEDNSLCAYYNNILVIYNKDIQKLVEDITNVTKFSNHYGVPTVIDKSNMGDIWYSTISGMFRSNLVSPLMEIDESKNMFFI